MPVLWSKDASGVVTDVWAEGWHVEIGDRPVAVAEAAPESGDIEEVPEAHVKKRPDGGIAVRAGEWIITFRRGAAPDWVRSLPFGGVVARGLPSSDAGT